MMKLSIMAAGLMAISSVPAMTTDIPESTETGPITQGTSYTLASIVMKEDREINVWLPPSYNSEPDRTYPVLYVIDGGTEQDFPHIAGLAQHGAISWNFEQVIVVGIKTNERVFELTQPATDERYGEYQKPNGGADQFRDFISQEAQPWVAANYRTNDSNAVIGESLAGLFIVDTLLKTPDMFDDYISVSPSLWWNREELSGQSAGLLSNINGEPRRLFITMANEGGTMQRGLDTFLDALRAQKPDSLTVHYADRRNAEEHGSIYHIAALDALRRLYGLPHRTGGRSDTTWLYTGDVPELSELAKTSIAQDCTRENAEPTSFAEINADPSKWRGVCILPDSFRMDPSTLDK